MLPCGRDSSRGFRNWKAYRPQNCLCGEPPNHTYYPSPENPLAASCYTYSCARACFSCTHIFHQTFSMLVQQHSRENHQPYYTSIQDNRIRIIALVKEMSRYMLSGRIGVWKNAPSASRQAEELGKIQNTLFTASSFSWEWR